MKKLSNFIVDKKIYIVIVTVILLALSIIGAGQVKKNSDVTSYLPSSTEAYKGKYMLSDSFGILGDANIGISNVDKESIDEFIQMISTHEKYNIVDANGQTVNLFKRIAWIGTFDQIKQAIESETNPGMITIYQDILNKMEAKFIKNNTLEDGSVATTYIISLYLSIPNTDDQVLDLVEVLKADLDEFCNTHGQNTETYATGGAINAYNLLQSSIGDMPLFILMAVIAILLTLLFTTKSIFEPLIFLGTLGISILLNMGSNFLLCWIGEIFNISHLKEIATITNSAGIILQLALSMDYAIFLMHSYYEEMEIDGNTTLALKRALPKTIKAVSSSALTTIGGFVALFAMRFGIGINLGAVLAKGVLLSLLAVIFIEPVLICWFSKLIDKTKHKFFTPRLKKVAGLSIKYRWLIIIVCVVVCIPSFYLQLFKVPLGYLQMEKENPNPTITENVMVANNNQVILMLPYEHTNGGANYSNHYAFIDLLNENNPNGIMEDIFSIHTIVPLNVFFGAGLTGNELINTLNENFVGTRVDENGRSTKYILYTITMKGSVESQEVYDQIDLVKDLAGSIFGAENVYTTGLAAGAKDLARLTPTDFIIVSLVSALIILIVLIFAFKSLLIPLILLFVIEIGIFVNLAIVAIMDMLGFNATINFMSYIIISSIQLGATVDYAILYTSKFKECRKTMSVDDSLKMAMHRASPSIIISAVVLIAVCIAVNAVTSNIIVQQITELIARGSLMSSILVMTLLPAILKVFYGKKDNIADDPEISKSLEKPSKAKEHTDYSANDVHSNIKTVLDGVRGVNSTSGSEQIVDDVEPIIVIDSIIENKEQDDNVVDIIKDIEGPVTPDDNQPATLPDEEETQEVSSEKDTSSFAEISFETKQTDDDTDTDIKPKETVKKTTTSKKSTSQSSTAKTTKKSSQTGKTAKTTKKPKN